MRKSKDDSFMIDEEGDIAWGFMALYLAVIIFACILGKMLEVLL